MRILTLVPYLMVAAFSYQSKKPTTAIYVNSVTGVGKYYTEETIQYMENWSKSRFMHGDSPDLYITIRYGETEDGVLAYAQPYPGGCMITMGNDLNPESKNHINYVSFHMVLMHEIGHCFGLQHTDSEEDVMYYAMGPGQNSLKSIQEFFRQLNKIRGVKD